MTTAHPLAPRDEKKIKKQQQTDPQGEEKWEKQHRINQCMKTFFFPRGNGDDLHNYQFIYELI